MNKTLSIFRRAKVLKVAAVVGTVVALQMVLSLLIQIIVIREIGAGSEVDAFIGAQTISLIMTSIVGTALHNIWQSRLAIAANSDWKSELEHALTMTAVFVAPLAILLFFLSGIFTRLLFVGFSLEQLDRTISLTQINILGMVFNIFSLILSAGGRAVGRYIMVEIVPTFIAVIATVSVAITVKTGGIYAVTWIMCARAFAIFLFLWVLLNFPLPRLRRDKNLRNVFKDVLALMSGSSIYKLGPVVDRYWASQATAGNLTIYNLAQSVMGAIASLLERAISLPAIPQLSRDISEAKYDSVGRKYKRTLLYIWSTILAGGLLVWLAFFSIQPSIAIVFNLNMRQVQLLVMLSFALLGFLGVAASGGVINAMFYSMGDVKTPVSIGIIGFFFGLLIKSLAFVNFGLVAMAIGTSIYYLATMIVMIAIFERRLREKRS